MSTNQQQSQIYTIPSDHLPEGSAGNAGCQNPHPSQPLHLAIVDGDGAVDGAVQGTAIGADDDHGTHGDDADAGAVENFRAPAFFLEEEFFTEIHHEYEAIIAESTNVKAEALTYLLLSHDDSAATSHPNNKMENMLKDSHLEHRSKKRAYDYVSGNRLEGETKTEMEKICEALERRVKPASIGRG